MITAHGCRFPRLHSLVHADYVGRFTRYPAHAGYTHTLPVAVTRYTHPLLQLRLDTLHCTFTFGLLLPLPPLPRVGWLRGRCSWDVYPRVYIRLVTVVPRSVTVYVYTFYSHTRSHGLRNIHIRLHVTPRLSYALPRLRLDYVATDARLHFTYYTRCARYPVGYVARAVTVDFARVGLRLVGLRYTFTFGCYILRVCRFGYAVGSRIRCLWLRYTLVTHGDTVTHTHAHPHTGYTTPRLVRFPTLHRAHHARSQLDYAVSRLVYCARCGTLLARAGSHICTHALRTLLPSSRHSSQLRIYTCCWFTFGRLRWITLLYAFIALLQFGLHAPHAPGTFAVRLHTTGTFGRPFIYARVTFGFDLPTHVYTCAFVALCRTLLLI